MMFITSCTLVKKETFQVKHTEVQHIYTLFDGLRYNTRRYFVSCVVYEQ